MTALSGNNISPLNAEWKSLAGVQKSREVKITDVMSSLRKPLSMQCRVIYDGENAGEQCNSGLKRKPPSALCRL